jgi:hypothetical protein
MFEIRVLKKIIETKKEEVAEGGRITNSFAIIRGI